MNAYIAGLLHARQFDNCIHVLREGLRNVVNTKLVYIFAESLISNQVFRVDTSV